jgi:hypothetical protein
MFSGSPHAGEIERSANPTTIKATRIALVLIFDCGYDCSSKFGRQADLKNLEVNEIPIELFILSRTENAVLSFMLQRTTVPPV